MERVENDRVVNKQAALFHFNGKPTDAQVDIRPCNIGDTYIHMYVLICVMGLGAEVPGKRTDTRTSGNKVFGTHPLFPPSSHTL